MIMIELAIELAVEFVTEQMPRGRWSMVILIIIFTKELKDYLIYGWVAWDGALAIEFVIEFAIEQMPRDGSQL